MMNAEHPLSRTRILLEEIASERDADHLGQCLAGQHLPLLGGDDHPADILFSALSLPPYDPDLAVALAEVTAQVCAARTETLQGTSDKKSLEDDLALFNLFLFASYLPSSSALFSSLTALYETSRQTSALSPGKGMAGRQLRQALIRQQTDESFETVWLGLIASVSRGTIHITPEEEEDLLTAWEGLLWIPPSESDRKACNIVCVPRVDAGLRALHDAVHRATHGVRILRYAAGLLHDSFPRSAEFWVECFSSYISDYPELLRETLIEQWPMLEDNEETELQLSSEAEPTWRLFTPEEQSEVQALVGDGDPSRWNSFWENILFTAPRGHFTPQDWRSSLFLLKNELESENTDLSSNMGPHREKSGSGMKAAAEATPRPKGKRKKLDRLAAFERASAVVAEIDSLLHKGDTVTAKKYLDNIISQQEAEGSENQYIAMTLCNVATSARDTGELAWAQELYIKAQHFNPNDVVPSSGLADTLKAMGELEEAKKLYTKTIEQWPNEVVPRNGLADTLKAMGQLDEAEALYRKTCKNDTWKNEIVPRCGLAETLKAQGKLEEAEMLYRKTCENHTWENDVVPHTGLAETLRAQGKLEEARDLYTEIITRWPNEVVPRNGLAETLKAMGEWEEARNLYTEIIKQWPRNIVPHAGLAETLKAMGKLKKAKELYTEIIKQWPNDVVPHAGLAETLKAGGELKKAKELYAKIIKQWPNNVVLHAGLADTLKTMGELEETRKLYAEIIKQWPNEIVPRNGLAETFKAMGEFEKTKELYAEIIKQWPNDVVPRNGLAETLKTMGELEKARILYTEIIKQWPNDVVPHTGLADILKAMGELNKAETLYRQITVRWPHDRVPQNGLANVLRKQKKYGEAFAILTGATSFSDLQNRYDIHLRGMILLESGDVDAAIDIFESGLRANLSAREHNVFSSALAIARLKQRNSREALKYIETLPDLPSTEVLRLHAYAEAEDIAQVQQSCSAFTSRKVISFPARAAFKRIEAAYCLKTDKICQPSPTLFDEVIGAEIDMLIEAESEMRFALAV